MRWRLVNFVALLLCIFIPQCLPGQKNTQTTQSRRYKIQYLRFLRIMDLNKDKKLSKAEWKGKEVFFDQLDTNSDGFITEQEFCIRSPMDNPEITYPEPEEEQESFVIRTSPLIMTGKRFVSQEIRTESLIMTGKRVIPVEITTSPLVMTGMRIRSLIIQTDQLIMTGKRVTPIEITTNPLVMTGMRLGSIQIQTNRLIMTGNRKQ